MLTKEEKAVAVYSKAKAPTVPREVTPETELETLNLNWRERDLPEKERTKHVHRLHPYLGKFIPQLVEIFLRKYFTAGQTVLDPFCGSGTTLVQANELGINAVGYDISAFNVMLCRAKTGRYSLPRMRFEVMDILQRVHDATQTERGQLRLWGSRAKVWKSLTTDNEYLLDWYAPKALEELLTYLRLLESGEYKYKNLLRVILSRAARSARLTTHFNLDFPETPQTEPYWCYKHSRLCEPVREAFKFLRRYSIDTINRVQGFARRRTEAGVVVRHADARRATFPPIDGVLTSPPYLGLIDYHEQHAYAYHLLGLKDNRAREIGPAVNGRGQEARKQYEHDVAEVFRRAAASMRVGSPMIVVANDKANLYHRIAERAGVQLEAIVKRHVNRRTGRRSNQFYESIFIWRKD